MVEKIKRTIEIAKQKKKENIEKNKEKRLEKILNDKKSLNKVVSESINEQQSLLK